MVMRTALVLLLLLALAVPDARAEVVRGTRAPPIDARGYKTGRSIQLEPLRGRMVLLEFFGTDCPHCQEAAPRMNAIHERFAGHGLVTLGLTPDAPDKATRYARTHRVRHRLAQVPLDTLRAYGITRYPIGVLIAPDGRVLWRGKPSRLTDRVIEAYLAKVRILPQAPAGHAMTQAAMQAGGYATVERSLEHLKSCARIDAATCRYVLETLDWIQWHRERAWQLAATDERRGRWAMAHATYAELEAAYVGTPTAERAAAARARLLAKENQAREIRAADALMAARRSTRWEDRAQQVAALRTIQSKHGGTAAAAEAGRLLRDEKTR